MKSYILIVTLIGFAISFPVEDAIDDQPGDQAEDAIDDQSEPVDFTEGDMILTPEQKQKLFNPPKSRNGITNVSQRWPNNIVYYQFTSSIRKFSLVTVSISRHLNNVLYSHQR